jgi:hypothetical protein
MNSGTQDKQMAVTTFGGMVEGIGMSMCFGEHFFVGLELVILGVIFIFLSNHIS